MINPSYKFICYPYECDLGSSTNVQLEHTILDHDVYLHDLLDQFQSFLQAAGYTFAPGDSLQVVNDADDYLDDGDDYLEDLDDEGCGLTPYIFGHEQVRYHPPHEEEEDAEQHWSWGEAWDEYMVNPPLISRLEVIDDNGRSYVNVDVESIQNSIQDDGRTLKIFVTSANF